MPYHPDFDVLWPQHFAQVNPTTVIAWFGHQPTASCPCQPRYNVVTDTYTHALPS